MKNKLVTPLLILAMLLGMTNTAVAKDTRLAKKLASELTVYYEKYQQSAETDIARVLEKMKVADETYGKAWEKIMDYWFWANTDGFANVGAVPQGLPQDDSLCIVILGYALDDDGTMQEELIGRLEMGLAIAEAYPNAYVCVTGGNSVAGFTEGDLMGEWLLKQGLKKERLIVENASKNTIENVNFTYKILKNQYAQVNKVVLVTSDYHIPRGSVLYYTKFVLGAYASGNEEIQIVANAGFATGRNSADDLELQAQGVRSIAGLEETEVTLSLLDGLTVTQETLHNAGNDLNLTVEAKYDSGYSRIVNATVTEFDQSQDANQTVTVSYTENDVTVSGQMCLTETKAEFLICQADTKAVLFSKLQRPGAVQVKLGTDIELTYSSCKIPEGTTAILDLNGYRITSVNGSAVYLQNDGVLVIRDSSAEKTGGIAVTATNARTAVKCIQNNGTLTIEGGTFTATSDGSEAYIVSGAEGSVTVCGGMFKTDSAIFDGGIVTVTGGTFLDASGERAQDVSAYFVKEDTQPENDAAEQSQESKTGSYQWIILPGAVALLLLAAVLVKAKKKRSR